MLTTRSVALVGSLFFGFAALACSDAESSAGTVGGAGGSAGTGGAGGSAAGTSGGVGGSAGTAGVGGTSGTTTACKSEDDCFGPTAHCDVAKGTCTGCRTNDDCRGALFCDTTTGICRDCVSNSDCGGGRPTCDRVSGQCTIQCSSDADCANTGGPTKCDTSAGRGVCVDCTGNNQNCRFCETKTFSCVGCLADSDCPAAAPFCGPSFECSPSCTVDNDCPAGLHCDPKTSRCLECATNAHCPGEVLSDRLYVRLKAPGLRGSHGELGWKEGSCKNSDPWPPATSAPSAIDASSSCS